MELKNCGVLFKDIFVHITKQSKVMAFYNFTDLN